MNDVPLPEEHEKRRNYKEKRPFLSRGFSFGLIWPFANWRVRFYRDVTGIDMLKDSPIMLYITEEGSIVNYRGVSTGIHSPRDKWGRKKGYDNRIESRKLLDWEYGGISIPTYIHYERETYAYPHEPKIDAQMVTKGVKILKASFKDFDERDTKFKKKDIVFWLKVAGIILGVVILVPIITEMASTMLGVTDPLDKFFGSKEVVETVKTIYVNSTGGESVSPPIVID